MTRAVAEARAGPADWRPPHAHGSLMEGQHGRFLLFQAGLGLTCDPKEITWKEWWEFGKDLSARARSLKWHVADWLSLGQWRFGEKFAQAQELFPWWDEQTLLNIQRVGRRISRRREELTFEHHEVVASLPPEKQDEYLSGAIDAGLSRQTLRDIKRADASPDREAAMQRYAVERAVRSADSAARQCHGEVLKHVRAASRELGEALAILDRRLGK